MAGSTPGTEGNRLLASLPREEMERILPHLGRVTLALGEVIYESGGRQSYLSTDELVMTQELIANMLGVRREGVTNAAGRLQENGLICYVRGHITVLNRRGLEAVVCECYKVVKDEYGGLRGGKGLSLCERIRVSDSRTPIVIFSGHASAPDIAAGMHAGAHAYLVKPDSSELIPTIMRLLEAAAGSRDGM